MEIQRRNGCFFQGVRKKTKLQNLKGTSLGENITDITWRYFPPKNIANKPINLVILRLWPHFGMKMSILWKANGDKPTQLDKNGYKLNHRMVLETFQTKKNVFGSLDLKCKGEGSCVTQG